MSSGEISAPAPSEKYSPLILPYPEASPKFVFCRATAPGASILTGTSFLAIRISCSSWWLWQREKTWLLLRLIWIHSLLVDPLFVPRTAAPPSGTLRAEPSRSIERRRPPGKGGPSRTESGPPARWSVTAITHCRRTGVLRQLSGRASRVPVGSTAGCGCPEAVTQHQDFPILLARGGRGDAPSIVPVPAVAPSQVWRRCGRDGGTTPATGMDEGTSSDKPLTFHRPSDGHQAARGGFYSRSGQTCSSLTRRTSGLLLPSTVGASVTGVDRPPDSSFLSVSDWGMLASKTYRFPLRRGRNYDQKRRSEAGRGGCSREQPAAAAQTVTKGKWRMGGTSTAFSIRAGQLRAAGKQFDQLEHCHSLGMGGAEVAPAVL